MSEADRVSDAVVRVLDRRADQCRPEHVQIGREVVDELGLTPPIAVGAAPSNTELGIHTAPTPVTIPPRPRGLDLGLYLDDGPKRTLTAAYLDALAALPLTHGFVMVERSLTKLDRVWSDEQLERFADATPQLEERAPVLWAEPHDAYIAQLERELPGMLRALRTHTVVLDLEHLWKRKRLRGYRSMRAAGRHLMAVCREAGARWVIVTSFPLHAESSGPGSVQGEDELNLQTYAIAKVRGEVRSYHGRLGPIERPMADMARARARVGPSIVISAAIAAWGQDAFPGEPEVAMGESVASSVRGGAQRITWWSSKHVIGVQAQPYTVRAIEAARPLSRLRSR